MVSGFDKRGTNYENVWEHGNIGQYWKGTREQGPPLGDPHQSTKILVMRQIVVVKINCCLFSDRSN